MTSEMSVSRRNLLLCGTATVVAAALPAPSLALTIDQARGLVDSVVKEVTRIVNSSTSEGQAIASFERILDRYSELAVIARAVLGPPWRQASGAQQKAYVTAFRGYVARKYGRQFREFKGAQVQITGAADRGNKGVLVNTSVKMPGREAVNVTWQVSDRGGSPKVLDIIVEGIRMISTERTEVGSILSANRNNLDALIADLSKRG